MPGVSGENLTFTFNTDGSIDIPVDNNTGLLLELMYSSNGKFVVSPEAIL